MSFQNNPPPARGLDEVARLICRAHSEGGRLSDTDAMAAAEAVETRKATSRKGTGSVSAKAHRRRSPGKAKPVRPRRAVAMFGRVSAKPVTSFTLVEAVAWSKASSVMVRAGALLREGARANGDHLLAVAILPDCASYRVAMLTLEEHPVRAQVLL